MKKLQFSIKSFTYELTEDQEIFQILFREIKLLKNILIGLFR